MVVDPLGALGVETTGRLARPIRDDIFIRSNLMGTYRRLEEETNGTPFRSCLGVLF